MLDDNVCSGTVDVFNDVVDTTVVSVWPMVEEVSEEIILKHEKRIN